MTTTVDDVRRALLQAARQSEREGRAFAIQIQALAEASAVTVPAFAAALAIAFAGVIVSLDECPETLSEQVGGDVPTDEARIDLLVESVLAALVELRAEDRR